MTWRIRPSIATALAAGALAAGCGSSPPGRPASSVTEQAGAVALDTSLASGAGDWATVVMGGPAAQNNDFWQLFFRSPGTGQWTLITPPGTADNGGLVLASIGGQSAVTAFRPSRFLTFTPLTQTADGGRSWSALSPLDAPLASTPGALALQPSTGQMLALSTHGAAEQSSAAATGWQTLTSARVLAMTSEGRRCGLTSLTSVGYAPSGTPLVAGSCSSPGISGLFSYDSGAWRRTGPAIPARLMSQDVSVLRLVLIGPEVIALLQSGTGHDASLLAAWSGDGAHWTVSQPLSLRGAALASASFGPGSAVGVMTTSGDAALVNGPAAAWRGLPRIPAGTAALAYLTGGEVDALAVDRAALTVWRLVPGQLSWSRAQVIKVPIQYGSSG